MSDAIYTPNKEAGAFRQYVDVACVVSRDTVWRYVGCDHHIGEMIKAEREAGSAFSFHLFGTMGTTFCGACWHLDGFCECHRGKPKGQHTHQAMWISNQTAFAVLHPGTKRT